MTAISGNHLGELEHRRTSALLERYRRAYRRPAAFVVRAPGRVNLIGEHTDYNGLAVLPMAIDRSVLMVGAPRCDRLVYVGNVASRFASCSCNTARAFAVRSQQLGRNFRRSRRSFRSPKRSTYNKRSTYKKVLLRSHVIMVAHTLVRILGVPPTTFRCFCRERN